MGGARACAPREHGRGRAGRRAGAARDLSAIVKEGRALPLADAVAHRSRAESFLRLSLLALVGDARAGEGFAGQLGALPLDVAATGDGWPEPVDGRVIAALTPGEVAPRTAKEPRHG